MGYVTWWTILTWAWSGGPGVSETNIFHVKNIWTNTNRRNMSKVAATSQLYPVITFLAPLSLIHTHHYLLDDGPLRKVTPSKSWPKPQWASLMLDMLTSHHDNSLTKLGHKPQCITDSAQLFQCFHSPHDYRYSTW